jgi:hypothetical protein
VMNYSVERRASRSLPGGDARRSTREHMEI